MHWGFSYLREDIQDVRHEFRGQIQELRDDIRSGRQETRDEIRELAKRMDSRFYLTISTMIAMTVAIIGSMKL